MYVLQSLADICGHRTLKAPHPVRSAKLSKVSPSQYCGGGPRGNPRCCSSVLFFFHFCLPPWAGQAPFILSVYPGGEFSAHAGVSSLTTRCVGLRFGCQKRRSWYDMLSDAKSHPTCTCVCQRTLTLSAPSKSHLPCSSASSKADPVGERGGGEGRLSTDRDSRQVRSGKKFGSKSETEDSTANTATTPHRNVRRSSPHSLSYRSLTPLPSLSGLRTSTARG